MLMRKFLTCRKMLEFLDIVTHWPLFLKKQCLSIIIMDFTQCVSVTKFGVKRHYLVAVILSCEKSSSLDLWRVFTSHLLMDD